MKMDISPVSKDIEEGKQDLFCKPVWVVFHLIVERKKQVLVILQIFHQNKDKHYLTLANPLKTWRGYWQVQYWSIISGTVPAFNQH